MKVRLLAALLLIGAGVTACGGGSSKAASTPSSSSTSSGSSSSTSSGSSSSSAGSSTAGASVKGQTILDAMKSAPYEKTTGTSNSKNVEAAKNAVLKAVPGSTFGSFEFSGASDTVISASLAFLGAQANNDQVLAFAFLNGGKCEAVGAVIPQASSGKNSDDDFPSKFVVIDMTSAPRCTADEANDAYKA